MDLLKDKILFGIIFKRSFWTFYDRMMFWIGCNLISIWMSVTLVLLPWALLNLFYANRVLLYHPEKELNFKKHIKNFIHIPWSIIGFTVLICVWMFALMYAVFLYTLLPINIIWLKMLVSSLLLWVLIFSAMCLPYVLHLLWGRPRPFKEILNISALAVLKYPLLNMFVFILTCLTLVFLYISMLGFFLAGMIGVVIVWFHTAYLVLEGIEEGQVKPMDHLDERTVRELFSPFS